MTRSSPLPTLLFAGALLLTGCASSDAAAKVAQAPLEAPSPTPPPIQPVAGQVAEVGVVDTSRPDLLGLADDGGVDQALVDGAAAAVTAALDQFIDSAQRGAPDLALLDAGWLPGVNEPAATALQNGLTTQENPVTGATYRLQVHAEPAPTTVAAAVIVDRRDGTSASVELVFDVTGEAPALQVVGGSGAA